MVTNNLTYDKYISLRPEFLFDNFNIQKLLQIDKFIMHTMGRLDYYQIGNFFIPSLLTSDKKEQINKAIIERNKQIYPSFEPLFVKYIASNVLNIEILTQNIGNKIEVNSFVHNTIVLKKEGICTLTFEEYKQLNDKVHKD